MDIEQQLRSQLKAVMSNLDELYETKEKDADYHYDHGWYLGRKDIILQVLGDLHREQIEQQIRNEINES